MEKKAVPIRSDDAPLPQNDSPTSESPGEDVRSGITHLVREHHALVYRYAYRLTGSASDAEDLAQDTFVSAVRHWHQLREPERAAGWLLSIVRNGFLKQKQRKVLPTEPFEPETLQEPVSDLPDWIDSEQLQQALLRLPDDARVILLLFFFEDCSYQQIAEQLNLPLGTVMSRLSRAKDRLKRELSKDPAATPTPP